MLDLDRILSFFWRWITRDAPSGCFQSALEEQTHGITWCWATSPLRASAVILDCRHQPPSVACLLRVFCHFSIHEQLNRPRIRYCKSREVVVVDAWTRPHSLLGVPSTSLVALVIRDHDAFQLRWPSGMMVTILSPSLPIMPHRICRCGQCWSRQCRRAYQ